MIDKTSPASDWKFVIRVYALIINERKEVLLSDEFYNNTFMTKFPGGGLEFGESTLDCLRREAVEEFGQEIEVVRHFYTTDFFQQSLFHKNAQLLSIYYLARFTGSINFKVATQPFQNTTNQNGSISFRWKSIELLSDNDLSFPIDKHVAKLIKDMQ